MQPGDVKVTSSNCERLATWIGFKPNTPIQEGVNNFVNWYRKYYGL